MGREVSDEICSELISEIGFEISNLDQNMVIKLVSEPICDL